MERAAALARLCARDTPWDLLVVGGGAVGLGVALDAALRGYAVLLVERDDFAAAPSSRSTKLLHGGVRYLRQGNVRLVREALAERGRVLANAPHLAAPPPFVIPAYRFGEKLLYGAGLAVYEKLAGRASLGRSRMLDAAATRAALPGLRSDGLRGGVRYLDGQFDDARLAVCLAQSAWDHGATVLNHTELVALLQRGGTVSGGVVRDRETGACFEVPARVVVNATGAWIDETNAALADGGPAPERIVGGTKGSHLVLDHPDLYRALNGNMIYFENVDGRVCIVFPYLNRVLLGSTDIRVDMPTDVRCEADEVDYMFKSLSHVFPHIAVRPEHIVYRFSGVRPLPTMSAARVRLRRGLLMRDTIR